MVKIDIEMPESCLQCPIRHITEDYLGGGRIMVHRTADEMDAFAEGYMLCFQQFEKYLLDDTPIDKTLNIMSIMADTVNATAKISVKEEE